MNVSRSMGIAVFAVLAAPAPLRADVLADEVAALDSALFAAFNACDAARFSALLTDDLEFFHDKEGLMQKKLLVDGLAETCIRRNKGEQPRVRRELVAGSLETYPIKAYGAVQTGAHRFYEIVGPKETLVGLARFLHVWKKTEGGWKLARVVSYAHEAAH